MITIEIDTPTNGCLSFRPLGVRVRGAFDYQRDSEPMSKLAASEFSAQIIPGQRIGFADGVGFVEESLHDDEHAATRERIEAKGFKIPPQREKFENAHEASWLFWLKRAVDAGHARIVSGKFPAKLPGKPRMNFITNEQPSTSDRLTAAIERQNQLLAGVLDRLAKSTE